MTAHSTEGTDQSTTPPVSDTAGQQDPIEAGGIRAYGQILRTPGVPLWVAVVLAQRIPIAMSPLALVYAGHAATGSYATGALLAGAFALAEAAAAGPGGRRFDRRPAGRELTLVLSIQAVALGALALPLAGVGLPVWALITLAVVGGAVASGAHGGLRALLLRTVHERVHQAALGMEASLTTLLWAVGPAVVAGVGALTGELWPMVVLAACAALGAVLATRVQDPGPTVGEESAHGADRGILRRTWPALIQEGAVLMCVGAAYTTLPPLLVEAGESAEWAGPMLAGFAVAGIVGGLAYGARTWPGAYRLHSAVLVLGLILAVSIAAVAPGVALTAVLLLLAGLLGTPALTARAAAVQQVLPESTLAAGFSALYAAGGVGFGVAGAITAAMVEPSGARAALLTCTLVAGAAVIVSALAERGPRGAA